jgi:hypothetical protein
MNPRPYLAAHPPNLPTRARRFGFGFRGGRGRLNSDVNRRIK